MPRFNGLKEINYLYYIISYILWVNWSQVDSFHLEVLV